MFLVLYTQSDARVKAFDLSKHHASFANSKAADLEIRRAFVNTIHKAILGYDVIVLRESVAVDSESRSGIE